MQTTIERFLFGLRAPWRGLRILLSSPKLWIYSLPPFLISGGILIAGFAFIFQSLPAWLATWLPDPVGFLGLLGHWTGMFLGVFFAVMALGLLSLATVQIVAIPFNSLLAEKALSLIGGYKAPSLSFAQWVMQSLRLLRTSFFKSLLFLIGAAIIFVLSLIPIVQIAAILGGLYVAACDCADYSLEALNRDLKQRLEFFRKYSLELLGFGVTMGGIFLVPGLNLFFFPSAIVGGVLLVLELDRPVK